ncbi:MAG: rhodanese-like domain-containing protein, partial [Campylobacterota bacterium]|nr:rhodanese-like domain-containing protein [Campylobacterota bacterium]
MKKLLLLIGLSIFGLEAQNILALQYKGVKASHDDGYDSIQKITIERDIDPLCLSIPINNSILWEDLYASREVPQRCKATFVKTLGQIQPLTL